MESSSLWLLITCIGHNIYDSNSPFSLLPSQFRSFSITVEYNYVCGVVIATLLKSREVICMQQEHNTTTEDVEVMYTCCSVRGFF